ncbi:Secretory immunoglobulin A-binding protein EsiB [Porphyridium purpureum]|uniref:Secretory immunoglobulin A-binding protein EsiB n=1 Tax=Porphyridium purpureum TaxID=35688 RepID=A0A5J4YJQ9_PORPP|nr:Secretory immunoglobulin A-binding protein EsiB [Porphyridium purpureum]|eukprot:POR4813..scf251_18
MMLQARLCHGVISRPLRALAWMAAFRLPSVLPRRLSWTPCSRELWNRSGRDESCGVRGMKSSVAVMRDRVDSPDDAGKSPVHEDCPEQDAAEAPGAKDDPSQEKSGVEAKGPSDAVNGTEADLLEANEWYELGMNEIKLGKYSEAFEWIRKAAEVGNADAQFAMGVFYEEARGNVEKDDRKAVAWYTKAAEKGHAKAQCNLGLLYSAGIDGGEPDDVTAVRLFRESAMQGHVAAQCNLSSFYFTGRGGNEGKSYLAIDWLRTAANEGLPAAQYNLGLCYERGQGVESDVREAFE